MEPDEDVRSVTILIPIGMYNRIKDLKKKRTCSAAAVLREATLIGLGTMK